MTGRRKTLQQIIDWSLQKWIQRSSQPECQLHHFSQLCVIINEPQELYNHTLAISCDNIEAKGENLLGPCWGEMHSSLANWAGCPSILNDNCGSVIYTLSILIYTVYMCLLYRKWVNIQLGVLFDFSNHIVFSCISFVHERHAMSCHVMPCLLMPCHEMSSHVMSCCTMLCHVVSYFVYKIWLN